MLASATASEGVPQGTSGIHLPADFSPEQDVLVLAGTGAGVWLAELQRNGIERVVVLAPGGEALPQGCRAASTAPEVLAHILDFAPAARRITLQRLAGGVSDEQFATLKKTIEHGGMNRATFATSGAIWVRHAFANLPSLARWPSVDSWISRMALKKKRRFAGSSHTAGCTTTSSTSAGTPSSRPPPSW